ncbi:hypothetical protein ACCO45_012660 [Purpureocillium lilacinum]|uniref:Uncharacterized protein n=1 Tax=Purpureocillium lilacinum TaxID=33203 RepID=A0ACC4D8L6_PURLI
MPLVNHYSSPPTYLHICTRALSRGQGALSDFETATSAYAFGGLSSGYALFSSGEFRPVLSLGFDTEYQAYTLKTEMRENLQNQCLCPTEMAKLIGEYWRSLEPAERKIYEDKAIATKP